MDNNQAKLQKLHDEESIKMKRIGKIDHELKETIPLQIRRLLKERKNLCKSVSHNMRLRNKIINELTEKQAKINKYIEGGKKIPTELSKDVITFPPSHWPEG